MDLTITVVLEYLNLCVTILKNTPSPDSARSTARSHVDGPHAAAAPG
eukprot:SAG31_NODE_24752_length_474_cov_8.112000_1_plen_46_part_01